PFEMGVVTIGSFDGKGQFNIIQDSVELEGDARYMNDETAEKIATEVKRMVHGLEEKFGVTCTLTYKADYPALYNDPALTQQVVDALQSMNDPDITEVKQSPPFSGSEDFSYYTKKIPGCFYFIGCKPKGVDT